MNDDNEKPAHSSPLVGELINTIVDRAAAFAKTKAKAAVDKYGRKMTTKVKKAVSPASKKKKTSKPVSKKSKKKASTKTAMKKTAKKQSSKKKRL